jgi:glyoxylase-like metal-dependent hydrolase (beta-lactamase superfamily II)
MQQLSANLFCYEDTCLVYIVRTGELTAVLVDFGSGDVLDHLDEIGVRYVTDILITHHHRDQAQGLARAVRTGLRIWVPHTEQDLFADADAHWQSRELMINYNMRQDRFSVLEDVPIAGTLQDYEERAFGSVRFMVVPTPGHTIGSITLLTDLDGRRTAFTGDLIAAPGQVWMMAATQWTYNGAEGAAASIASLLDLKDRQPDLLLPSHGEVMTDPAAAIDLLVDRLWQLLQLRGENRRLFELRDRPYEPISQHLLQHRASMANSYVLLSESGKALFIDFGYDFMTGFTAGYDRASRRPWLYTLPALKAQFGVSQVDVVLPTHFHDDHVAGFNLLRQVEGTKVWAADLFSDILEHPRDYDLPCLWYDPIPVDKAFAVDTPFEWEEYTFTFHPLPGHTAYAVAIAFEVDGQRVLATGDQYQDDTGLKLNYVYPNRFHGDDYVQSAALYARLKPDLILTGHWQPLRVPPGYFDQLAVIGSELQRLHGELLVQKFSLGEEGFIARLMPYQLAVERGTEIRLRVELRNPFHEQAEGVIRMVTPDGWQVTAASSDGQTVEFSDAQATLLLKPEGSTLLHFSLTAPRFARRRARLAVDVTVNGQRFGEQAESLITLT